MLFILIGVAEALCIAALVLVGIWMGVYQGGVAWDGSASEFNVHPIMMTLGLIVFNGNGKTDEYSVRLYKTITTRRTKRESSEQNNNVGFSSL